MLSMGRKENDFQLEALEPRVLLSSDALFYSAIPVAAIAHKPVETAHQDSAVGQNHFQDSLNYNPASESEGLLAGVSAQPLHSSAAHLESTPATAAGGQSQNAPVQKTSAVVQTISTTVIVPVTPAANVPAANGTVSTVQPTTSQSATTQQLTSSLTAANGPPASAASLQVSSNKQVTSSSNVSTTSKANSSSVLPAAGSTTSDIYQTILTNISNFGTGNYQATMSFNSGTLEGAISFQTLTLTFNLNSGGTAVTSVTISANSASLNLGGVTSNIGTVNGSYTVSSKAFSVTLNSFNVSFSSFLNISATTATINYTGGTTTSATVDILNSDGTGITTGTASVSSLTIGITGGSIFAGVNGPSSTSQNAQGISVSSVNMALALLYDSSSSGDSYAGATFYALQISNGSISPVGLPSGFNFSATGITVNVNGTVNGSGTTVSDSYWLDFSKTFGTNGLQIGGISVDYTLPEFQISATVTLNFDNFIYVSGMFTFQQGVLTTTTFDSTNDTLTTTPVTTLSTTDGGPTNETPLSFLELGGSNVTVFAGYNYNQTGAVGMELQDASFAFAMITAANSGGGDDVYYALTVTGPIPYEPTNGGSSVNNFSFVGLPSNFTVSASNFEVDLNGSYNTVTGSNPYALDFGAYNYANPAYTPGTVPATGMTPTLPGLEVTVNSASGAAIPLNFTEPLVQASGTILLNLDGFIYVSGSLAFQDGPSADNGQTITPTSGTSTATVASVLELGGNDLTIFAGEDGPSGTSGATGVELSGASFGLALVTDSNGNLYYGFTESGGTLSAVGLPSDFTFNVTDMSVMLNGTTGSGASLNFASTFGSGSGLSVPTGTGTSVTLNYTTPLLSVSGTLDIQLSSYLTLTGSFGFTYDSGDSTLTIGLGTDAFTGATAMTVTIGSGSSTLLTATGSLDMTVTSASGVTTTTINSATLTIADTDGYAGLEIPDILQVGTPTITITNMSINDSTGQISGANGASPGLTIDATSATLFPGNSTIEATVMGTQTTPEGFQGVFDLETGAFDINIAQFNLYVGSMANPTLTAEATGVTITYSPSAAPGQTLVSIANASVTFNSFSSGSNGSLTGTVTNLYIYDNGFQFSSLSVSYTGTIDLGPLSLTNPTVTLTNFGAIFSGGSVQFNQTSSLTASVGSASLAIGSVTASASNLSVTIGLGSSTLGDVTVTAGSLDFQFSTYLTFQATSVNINTNPGPGGTFLSVGTATVTLSVSQSLTIGGSVSNFSVIADSNGNAEFEPGNDFSVTLTPPSPSDLGLPNWLGFSIQSFQITWANNDFQTDPLNFIVTLSASINSIQGLPSGVSVSGSITDVIINVGELGTWLSNPSSSNFPISFGPDGGFGGSVSGTLFGMNVSATFVGGIVSFNAEGGIVNGTTVIGPGQGDTTVYGSGFYVGVAGSADIPGLGTVSMSLGFSNLGPLSFYLSYSGTLLLDPDSGLAITGFSAGVAFDQTMETPSTATDLPNVLSAALVAITGSTTGSPTNINVSQWQQQLELATAAQYVASNGGTNLSAAYSQPFLILASVSLGDEYLGGSNGIDIQGEMVLGVNPNAGPGQAPVTVLIEGSLTLDNSSAFSAANAYLYASITSSSASLMFLVNEPGSTPIESFGGALTFSFTYTDPNTDVTTPWTPADQSSEGGPTGFTLGLSGFFQFSAASFADVNIQGDVSISVTPSQTTIDLSGDVNVSFLGDLGDATGQIVLLYNGSTYTDPTNTTTSFTNNSGNIEIYGALELSTGAAFNTLQSYGLEVNGAALFQINTTGNNVLVELPPVPTAPSGTPSTPFVIQGSVLFDMTITGTSSPYATISYEVGGNQLFQMQGFFDLRITDSNGNIGAQMFADINSLTLGPSGASFLSFSGFGLFVISNQGLAAEINLTLGTGGAAISGISFNASFQLVINTTGQAVTFDIPSVSVPTSSSGSTQTAGVTVYNPTTGAVVGTVTGLVIPAGPPQGWLQDVSGTGEFPSSGAAGPYIVVTGVGSLSMEGLSLNGFFYFQLSYSSSTGVIFALVLDVNGSIPGVGSASVEGALQISSAGEVALLAISGGNGGGSTNYGSGITLQLTAELALNTTSSPVSSIGGVPLTSPSGSPITIAAGTYEIIATGTLSLNVGGVGFVISGVFSTTISTSAGVTVTTISLTGTLTATVSGSTLLTMNANGVLVSTSGGANPGMAGELTLTLNGSDPLDGNGFSFNGTFSLIINTTGVQQTVDVNGSNTTISAGADGSSTGGAYVEIDASGSMVFGTDTNGFLLNDGNFYLSVSSNGLAVSASATMVVEVGGAQLFSISASGAMLISSQGIAASLTVTSNLNDPNGMYAFSGTFTLQVNTTGVQQTIGSVMIPAGPGANATPGPYFQMFGNATLALGTTDTTSSTGVFLSGTFYLLIGSNGLTVAANGTLTATVDGSTLLSMQASGALLIISSGSNPGMAGELTLAYNGSSPLDGSGFSFGGTFNLEVNTTGVAQTVPLGSSTIVISAGPDGSSTAGPYVEVDASGAITFGTAQNGFVLTGDFFLAIGTGGLEASADVDFTAAIGGATLLTMNATGALVISSAGLAGELTLTLTSADPLDGSGFSFNGSFNLEVNTTGAAQNVPLGNSTVTISAGPNGSSTGGAYFEIDASGGMIFGSATNGFLLNNGNFYLSIGTTGFAVSAGATMVIEVGGTQLFSATAAGAMLISSQGFAASLTVTSSLTDPNGFYAFAGTFTLQVNTTGVQQTIGTVVIPAGPGANGSPSGPYFQMFVSATLALGTTDTSASSGVFLSGSFYLEIGTSGLTVAANGALTAVVNGSTLLTMNATGVLLIAIGTGVTNPGIAGELTLTISGGDPLNGNGLSFNGSFSLEVNSTEVPQTISTVTISAGPNGPSSPAAAYVQVLADGSLIFGSASTGFALSGDFYLSIATTGLAISAQLSFTADVAGSQLLSVDASGAMLISSAGLAASFTLTASGGGTPAFGLSSFSFSGAFLFEINTTGVQQTIGTTVIAAGPGSSGSPAGPYFQIAITGATSGTNATLTLGSSTGFQLSGSFYLTISSSGIAVSASATLSVIVDGTPFFSLTADGALLINSNGIAAEITLSAGTGSTIPGGSSFSFASMTFVLEVNTTGAAVTTINNLTVNLPASSAFFEIAASGQLSLGGVVNISGGFLFEVNGASMQISINAVLAVFGIDFSVSGFAQLSSAGLVLGVNLSFGNSSSPTVTLIPGVLALSGTFTLEINTTDNGVNVTVGSTNYSINAKTTFQIYAQVSFNVLGYSLGSANVYIGLTNGVLSATGSLSFNFFGFITFNVSFYFDSNYNYWFYGYTYVQLGSGSFNIHGSLTLEFASQSVANDPSAYGSQTSPGTTFEIQIAGGVTAFGWNFASISATIQDTNNNVYFSIYVSVSFWLFSIGGTVTIDLGSIDPPPAPPPPPPVGTVLSGPVTVDGQTFNAGTLLINLGTYAEGVGVPALPSESYTITVVGYDSSNGTYDVEVNSPQIYTGTAEYSDGTPLSAPAGTVEYTGVTEIAAPDPDTGSGTTNLTLSVGNSYTIPVVIFTGSGTNSLTTGAGTTTIHGSDGTDTVIGGSGNVTFYTGTGTSSFTGGGTNATSTENWIYDGGPVSVTESGYSSYSLTGNTPTTATLTYDGNTDNLSGSNITVTLTAPSSGSASFQVTNYTGEATLDANGNAGATTTVTVGSGDLALNGNIVSESNGVTGTITLQNGSNPYGSLNLDGSASGVTITVYSWSGSGVVSLNGVNDTYIVDLPGSGSFTADVTDTGTSGSLTVNTPNSTPNTIFITNNQVELAESGSSPTVNYNGIQSLVVNSGNSGANVLIESIGNATTVNLGAGSNVVVVGYDNNSLAPIRALLTINGTSNNANENVLSVSDSADMNSGEIMTLTASALFGSAFGPGGSLSYDNVETLDIYLANPGSGVTGNTMNVRGMNGTVNIYLGNGNNTVNIGSTGGSGTLGGGTSSLTNIQGSLSLNGSGNDRMNVDDSGSSVGLDGILEPTNLTFGDPLDITFSGFSAMTIYLSQGADVFAVVDTFASEASSPVISIYGVGGNDIFDIFDNHAPLAITGGSGDSSIYVFANAAPLTLNGGTGIAAFYIFASVSGGGYLDNAPITITGGSAGTANTPNTLSIFGTSLADTFDITGALSFTNLGLDVSFSNIQGWTLEGLGGNNIFYVTAVTIPTTLIGDGSVPTFTVPPGLPDGLPPVINVGTPGLNLFYVGWQGFSYIPGSLTGINAPLTLSEGNAGTATVYVSDTSAIYNENYTLTPTTVTSTDMPASIVYDSTIDTLDLLLGSGEDNVTVNGAGAGVQTIVNGGLGDDAFTVNGSPNLLATPLVIIGGANGYLGNTLTVNGSGTGNNFVITGYSINGLGAVLDYEQIQTVTVNGIAGNNTFTVNSVSAPTYLYGGTGNDTFTINGNAETLTITGGTGTNKSDVFDINGNSGILTATGGAGQNNFTVDGNSGTLTLNGSGEGNMFTVNGNAGSLTLNGSSTADTFTVNALGAPATINGGSGDESVIVNAPLAASLTVIGGTNAADSLTINGISGNDYFIITGMSVSGVGSPINYSNLGSLVVNGGVGNDTFQIDSDSTSTTVNGSSGNDTFYILTTSAPTIVNTNGGVNTIYIGSEVPSPDSSVLRYIRGAVTVNGDGSDTLNIDDSADAITETGTLTSSAFTGFGMGAGITYTGISSVNVTLGRGQAELNIQSTNAATVTYVNTGAGADTVNIGSLEPQSGGLLSGIQGALTVAGDGSDTMNVDDTGDTLAQSGVLTPTTLTGLGMAVTGIVYYGFSSLTISLGSGANTFTIDNTNAATATTLNSSSDNTINVMSTSGTTTVNMGPGSTINIGSLAPATGGVLSTIQGALIVTGTGNDTMNVDNTGDTAAESGTLTATRLTGFGMGESGIEYFSLATLNISLGPGGNTLMITGAAPVTTINGGDGTNSATLNFAGDFAVDLTLTNFGTATVAVAGNFTGQLTDGGSVTTMTVGGNLTGTLNISGLLGTLTVDGGTPGQITVGSVNIITVLAGYGNTVLNLTADGVQREILAIPVAGGTLPDSVTFAFVYDAESALIPQAAIRITNTDPTARSFNLELVVTNSATAQFNLSLVDSSENESTGVSNISVQGSLLTKLTAPELQLFTNLTSKSPGGVALPADSITGLELSGTLPEGFVDVAGIEGLAFGMLTTASGAKLSVSVVLGSPANIRVFWNVLGSDAALNPATDTFIIPFYAAQSVSFFAHINPSPDMGLVMTLTDSISNSLPDTAYVKILPTSTNSINPLVQSVTLVGSGASINSRYSIANITSNGSIGNITISAPSGATIDNAAGLGNVTATNIFGDIDVLNTGIYGIIQTTVGDIGQLTVNAKGQITADTSIISRGAITGEIVSVGNLVSTITTYGSFSGVIAAQGNIGAIELNTGGTPVLTLNALTRFGGIAISGADSGKIIALGNMFGNLTIKGSVTGRIATEGQAINGLAATRIGILGNVTATNFGTGAAIVSGGLIGDSTGGTSVNLGKATGFVAAAGAVNLTKSTTIATVNLIANATGANLSAINSIFTNNNLPLFFDTGGNLAGLALIETHLANLQDNNRVLS